MRTGEAERQAEAERRAREALRARMREDSDRTSNALHPIADARALDEATRDDIESEAVHATVNPGAPDGNGSEFAGAPVDDAARWPDEMTEAAFLAENGSAGSGASSAHSHFPPKRTDEDRTKVPVGASVVLPPLQSLIDRLPAETRDVLDDLFRVRFVSVKQVREENLK